MKHAYAHVTVYPDRIEWQAYDMDAEPQLLDDGPTGTEPINLFGCREDTLAWGRVMLSLTMHEVNEMEIRYEE